MEALNSYTSEIETGLNALYLPVAPERLYDPLRYFLSIGGKRIRPVLTLLGAEVFGKDRLRALPQALAVEVFHNFTLIHDDIMDDAPMRRGQQTVHEKWNHDVAILSGDVLMIKAYQLISDIAPEHLPAALHLFNKTAIEICEGQQMDMDFENRLDVSIAQYTEMIRLKTSVLLGTALELGAIVAGAGEEDRKHLYNFGQHIGIAFQIQDDVLDLYANPTTFGKQTGGDIIANKKTMLYLTALGKASMEQLEVMKQLHHLDQPEVKVSRTRELFDHLNVKASCEEQMQEHYRTALKSLEQVSVPSSQKQRLIALADYLMQRDI